MATSPKEIVSEAIDRAGVAMKSPSLKYPFGVNLYIFLNKRLQGLRKLMLYRLA
jgi:hypothetical protein